MSNWLLEVENLGVGLERPGGVTPLVDGVGFQLAPGDSLCLVGESGCGKSITALALAGLLLPPLRFSGGSILFRGLNVVTAGERELRKIRGAGISYIFQDPGAALNPVLTIGTQIRESLKLHRPEACNDAEIIRLLRLVQISDPEHRLRAYPHELSGGMQQRVMIAMAIAPKPALLVADEPTTALDVTVQAQILTLLAELKRELGMALILITHNLPIARGITNRMHVMYAGQWVETGATADILDRPKHPYTRALLRSTPEFGTTKERLESIPGTVPSPGNWPAGCRFADRCSIVLAECRTRQPALESRGESRTVRCPYPGE